MTHPAQSGIAFAEIVIALDQLESPEKRARVLRAVCAHYDMPMSRPMSASELRLIEANNPFPHTCEKTDGWTASSDVDPHDDTDDTGDE